MNEKEVILYSDLPRSVVYKNVEDIHSFLGDGEDRTLEQEFYSRLMNRSFIKEAIKSNKLVLTIFNNACYIYMMVETEYDPQLFNYYMKQAGDGVDDKDLKNHITAATMALLYNGLGCLLHRKKIYNAEMEKVIGASFNANPDEEIAEYRQRIYSYYHEAGNPVAPENQEDFLSLLVNDESLQSLTMSDIPFSMPTAEDFTNPQSVSIQDVVTGINYIIECYAQNNEPDDYLFLAKILERLEIEKSLVSDPTVLAQTKIIIQSEMKRLRYLPEDKFNSGLSLDNIIPISWDDGNPPSFDEETYSASEEETEVQEEPQNTNAWDNRYDSFFHDNLNVPAIYRALSNIQSPHLPPTGRGFWWVFYRVLQEIHWMVEGKGNQKMLLQWANQHFHLGWDWKKNYLFKFSDITQNSVIKNSPTSDWKKENTRHIIGDYYGELAKTMKETFVEYVNGGKMRDRNPFIIPGKNHINNGRR